ncbi:HipA domain-containing protein [Arcanobacterium wilhelmae]|nr:HipA domain-containing protein [Arcanobacterium wilhelmae]WFN90925.1 HipA domain-containing protein [Arcanobacterium wilhelmae]
MRHPGRSLSVFEYLTDVDDRTRMGNLRIAVGGEVVRAETEEIPSTTVLHDFAERTAKIGHLSDHEFEVIAVAGSSLGGARPKMTMHDDDFGLSVVKFPFRSDDDDDVEGWEAVALSCASDAGIEVAPFRHVRLGEFSSALVTRRFDRGLAGERIGYISAHTALGLPDASHPYSFEMLASVMDVLCDDPRADKASLFDRVAVSIVLDSVDDHMRNYGFLRTADGWRLAPAFDIVPDFRAPMIEATPIAHGHSGRGRTIGKLVDAHQIFGLAREEAEARVAGVVAACRRFRQYAHNFGIAELDDSVLAERIEARIA